VRGGGERAGRPTPSGARWRQLRRPDSSRRRWARCAGRGPPWRREHEPPPAPAAGDGWWRSRRGAAGGPWLGSKLGPGNGQPVDDFRPPQARSGHGATAGPTPETHRELGGASFAHRFPPAEGCTNRRQTHALPLYESTSSGKLHHRTATRQMDQCLDRRRGGTPRGSSSVPVVGDYAGAAGRGGSKGTHGSPKAFSGFRKKEYEPPAPADSTTRNTGAGPEATAGIDALDDFSGGKALETPASRQPALRDRHTQQRFADEPSRGVVKLATAKSRSPSSSMLGLAGCRGNRVRSGPRRTCS